MALGTIVDSISNARTLVLAHTAAVAAGEIIVSNGLALIAVAAKDANVAGVYVYMGKVSMPKAAPLVINVGDKVYFDGSANNITKTAAGNTQCGICIEGAASAATEVVIFLWPDNDAITTAEIANDAVTTAKILDANVTLAKLAAGIKPTHICIAAGEFTTAGGDAAESITVAGLVATDRVVASLAQVGSTPRTILTAIAGTGAIAVTMSGDPSTDHKINYACFRAVA